MTMTTWTAAPIADKRSASGLGRRPQTATDELKAAVLSASDTRGGGSVSRARRLIRMPASLRIAVMVSMLAVPLAHDPALAQMVDTVPAIGATSPFGMTAGTPVPPTGDGLGATELPSAGLSPAPTMSIGITGSGVACPAPAGSSAGMSGTSTTFDGGGMTSSSGIPASGTCDTSSTGGTTMSSAMSTASPGGAFRAGIPLGSVETGGGGLSPLPTSMAPNPMPLLSESVMPPASSSSTPTISLPNLVTPATGVSGPCQTVGAAGNPSTIAGC
jgi:hypothetical protein